MPFAQVDNVRLYFETDGTGDPLLLIAGQGTDHREWDAIRDQLADSYRIIVFDHRGTGNSDKPETPYSTTGFADDAARILDHLGISRAHVFGCSMGGKVAQWLAINHPDLVGSVILGCTSAGHSHCAPRPERAKRALANPPADPRAAAELLADFLVSPQYLAEHPEVIDAVVARRSLTPKTRRLHFQASEAHNAWDYLPSIAAPVLLIYGTDDELQPVGNAKLLAEQIPNSTLKIIDNARHNFFVEFPEETITIVTEFLERHPVDGLSEIPKLSR